MSAILLSAHVIVAILAVGPIAVAASMFPRYARDGGAVADVLYRICRTYAAVAVAVPLLGIATAVSMGVLTQAWVLVSIGLTVVAAVVLIAGILPDQRAALAGDTVTRLAMTTGVFNLLWVAVTVLMIVRPGSTTGV
ncbi:hypothetical protein A5724_17520 [Mycobacterium sp. ACS1612]|uniref:hypothetical protein n=1 Tax=Mycobacterium sp. ACS1612 TaxID=1834117 RepID=UPI0007FCE5FF|nr:hypothetical protein [Mycobacterium sp. ACS1612]OBF34023.1 hypothetical protein A5724_17520 [Mycobacterium sp. ACS1612]